jgi:hypothetical protein
MIDTFIDQPMKGVIKTYVACEILQVNTDEVNCKS